MRENGKIARLPEHLREELNTRLRNGELGVRLVVWLNSLPEVQAIMAQHFGGRPIKPQNLTKWRQHGYVDWLGKKLISEARAQPDEASDPALKELRQHCQTLVVKMLLEHLAWYWRGFADAQAVAAAN